MQHGEKIRRLNIDIDEMISQNKGKSLLFARIANRALAYGLGSATVNKILTIKEDLGFIEIKDNEVFCR